MTSWIKINKDEQPIPIKEITEGIEPDEPLELYRQRYLDHFDGINKINRYLDEVLTEDLITFNDSMLIIGSGHSIGTNLLYSALNIKTMLACDLVEEAGKWLNPQIDFSVIDIRIAAIPEIDWVYSSHTFEHFNRQDALYVARECIRQSQKGVLLVVPYKDIGWGGEPRHRCEFNEKDEFTYLFDYYKIIHNGVELCLFKDNR